MGLNEYKKKRTFNNTPEPRGGSPGDEALHFVIQKHAASRLHYDFRLEIRGVLKSWAIPKGPSLNPSDKRLAMSVEDHPYDYKDFEGIIPQGNYGAGTVIIWDEGTYEPLGSSDDKSSMEKVLIKGLQSGSLKIRMHGKKLKGEYALVHTPKRAENAWLLIKHRDKYASERDITLKDKSVVSGKTLEQVAKSGHADEWVSNRTADGKLKKVLKTENGKAGQKDRKMKNEYSEAVVKALKSLPKKKRARMQSLPVKEVIDESHAPVKNKIISKGGKKERKTLINPTEETQVRNIEGHELKFTNLSKIFWPEQKVTKRDMLNYYYQVVPFMLPYMKDRPQTLNRFPNGIHGKSFYQKDVTGKVPGWISTYQYYSEADERKKHFLVCTDEASLLYIASLGCIEMNPWSSRTQTPDHPDWCIIDLDPDKNPFDEVIETAQVTKQVLDEIGVPAYCKTSGSTGLHIYIPLGAKYTYEESKEFGRAIVRIVQRQLPSTTSIERLVSKRSGKIYLDFLQNRPQATVAAPYSLRPKPGAPLSMPLHWEEVRKGLTIQSFNIYNAIPRLKAHGDLFSGVLSKGIDMQKALKNLERSF